MKKILFLLAMLAIGVSAWAIPAHKGAAKVTQPDGTQVTIQLHGDEFYHFNTTLDGYTVLQNEAGAWVYATSMGDYLAQTNVLAHDAGHRDATETGLLAITPKYLKETAGVNNSKLQRARRDVPAMNTPAIDYTQFRGLIILINYKNRTFEMSDPQSFYNHMVNDVNFTGYTDTDGNFVNCQGSVRDYYSTSSMGLFQPVFDVVGPYTVNYNDTQGNNYSSSIFTSALSQANSSVNFANYDCDNDGVVDMVFFYCAGLASAFSGNNSGYLWPHKSSLGGYTRYDGKYVRTYACSTEVYGWEDYPETLETEGIGTICHEFSHVMGLPDLYDANYETNGQSHDPGDWDVMASGGGHNVSRNPVTYSIFERYFMGWANPPVITNEGAYTLNPLISSNEGYIIKSPINKEFFMLENRQKTGFDSYLPGHGIIIARVDSTNTSVWSNNSVNNNSSRNYYELLRAGNSTEDAQASDPFPGTGSIMTLNNETTPSLKTWSGRANTLSLINIRETDGVSSFFVFRPENVQSVIEDFEGIAPSTAATQTDVQGNFAKWTFRNCNVAAVTEGSSTRSMKMKSGSAFMMSTPFVSDAYQLTLTIRNTTSSAAKFVLKQLVGDESDWTKATTVPDAAHVSTLSVPKNSTVTHSWPITLNGVQPLKLFLNMTSGSSPVYVDDFTLYYTDTSIQVIEGDVNADGAVDGTDINILVAIILGNDDAANYNGRADLNGDGIVDVIDLNREINFILDNN